MNQPTPINQHALQDGSAEQDRPADAGGPNAPDRTHCQSAADHLQHLVRQETQNGRTIIQNIVSIMNGDDPDATPHHRLQAARLLLNLGFQEAQPLINSLNASAGRQAAQNAQNEDTPAQQRSPEHERLNKKLVARIRVETGEGGSIVRILSEIMDGGDRDAKARDRIEAAKALLYWGFGNPSVPDPEFMSYYSPCHADCLCVCREMDEGEEVVEAHRDAVREREPLTEAQREMRVEAERLEAESVASAEQIARSHEAYQSEISYLPGNKKPRRPERSPPL